MTESIFDASAQQRSFLLSQFLAKKIKLAGGIISFAEFMEHALYHPALGYYSRSSMVFGESGDFITSSEITPLFANACAHSFMPILKKLENPAILEIGGGSGQFACDVISTLKKNGHPDINYFILEKSPGLKAAQQKKLGDTHPNQTIEWINKLPENFTGIIFLNEVLDALAAERFKVLKDGPVFLGVGIKDEKFIWQEYSITHKSTYFAIKELIDRYQLPINYCSEWHDSTPPFLKDLIHSLEKGCIFLLDYGYEENEYYRAERSQGTLTCFFQHKHNQTPLNYPGLQDISVHVNFTKAANCFLEMECNLLAYITQAAFLLNSKLLSLAEKNTHDTLSLSQSLKTLLLPNQMGERIKCMIAGKNIDHTFTEFHEYDLRYRL